jgi:hypothetical protein
MTLNQLVSYMPFISFRNQARAKVQSRITVPGETFKTLAASSMLSPPKKTQLNNLTLARIDGFQSLQGFIERSHVRRLPLSQGLHDVEWDLNQAAAALGRISLARIVNQNPTHQARCYAKKVGAIFPTHLWLLHQTN